MIEAADGTRFLEVNGHFRMGGTRAVRSDWRQAHLPALLQGAPGRAVFLGVGTGATLSGAAALSGIDATGVELTPEVVDLLPWFAEPGSNRPPVITADARRFMAAPGRAYDLVVADLFHPALDGSGALYTVEHFAAVRARLAPGGVFCQWLPLYQLGRPIAPGHHPVLSGRLSRGLRMARSLQPANPDAGAVRRGGCGARGSP